MGSVEIKTDLTEIDYVPVTIRTRAGDIILTTALIQQHLSDLFAHMVGLNPAIFTYLGHDLDTYKMITALKRLAKSDDCPVEIDVDLIGALNKCQKVLQERNNIAHGPMIFVDGMLLRFQVEGGEKPHRVSKVLSVTYFDKVLSDAKAALWAIRVQTIRMNKRRAGAQS